MKTSGNACLFHFFLAGILLPPIFGCSDGRPHRVPVRGAVYLDSQPLDGNFQGYVRLIPQSGGRSAQAALDENGQFILGNYEEADGCPPGNYRVEICVVRIEGNQMRYVIPPRYGNSQTSGVTVTIQNENKPLILSAEWKPEDEKWRKKVIVME
ncbi:MAG: hypothetical protein Q4D62_07820 [Planctomycetia bacterium]|nr:hypothetical protein [Planctomycetia bacterium]